ncbi:peroxiredoxin-like family protein [Deinococcus xianganensis]|uniref:Redoxin domain-containing protein n=1 Tax=Deinococcus xianganensis TaxID=1507289 RepID=A0A6I4YMV5_9DEIO|nr:peroxiredoxin-like family protein [Deinococcus xianganensis]MXV21321.1 redoxin domain-containing protein [Deinococcus xianganensis]
MTQVSTPQVASAMQAVLSAASKRQPAELHLSFLAPEFNTKLQICEGQITGIISALAPHWSTLLRSKDVPATAITQAHQDGQSVPDTLELLIRRRYLSMDEMDALAHERVLSALVPLAGRHASVQLHLPKALSHKRFLGSSDAQDGVHAAAQYAATLREHESAMTPADRFVATPLASKIEPEGGPVDLVYRAALRGLTLGQIAQRVPMRWDLLVRTISYLIGLGALRSLAHDVEHNVSPKLQVGQMAPDFILPDLHGGELRLSSLRGQRVWLTFNRQSTCALCNPHHAQIITMADEMKRRGVQILSIWGSTLEDLKEGIGRQHPPYPVLADPNDETYDQYGLTHSVAGTLDVRNLSTIVQGFKMMGTKALKSDGELMRMPAELLIDPDGRIAVAHYNSFGSDWLPFERVLEWAPAPRA